MPGASPTQLTLRYLREQGFLAQVVERWVLTRDPHAEGERAGMLSAITYLRESANLRATARPVEAETIRHLAGVIERSLPQLPQGSPGRRVDLFGFIDVLCLDGKPGCLGAQCCAYSGVSAHVKEIKAGSVKFPAAGKRRAHEEAKRSLALRWLAHGNRLSIFGWRKVDGKWTPRIVEITAELLGG